MLKHSVAALGIAALAGAGALTVLPQAQANPLSQYDGVQLAAACNPCNPCAAKAANPCAANKAAANPCAAKKLVPASANPCAAKNPCNPCAAKK